MLIQRIVHLNTALETQDLSCPYLAHRELGSGVIGITTVSISTSQVKLIPCQRISSPAALRESQVQLRRSAMKSKRCSKESERMSDRVSAVHRPLQQVADRHL